ncbi:bifunctional biotin--[acetyl-CoA-carboxylase] ligase/biotin operon repressor BirA [Aliivibrio wodanis]|uniref:bifunctional biotin--[acetyl-CoA-carboxylase] ligase/biotin operon repressor BirA n=1 Tax=Aliivibrio wodanis TaxID=80852 RepID=UPI00406CB2F7
MKEHVKKLAILRQLSDGRFHSGEDLGVSLNVSRSAISKHISALQEWGLVIYKIKGKGYSLSEPLELLSLDKIGYEKLPPPILLGVTDSTNQYLLDEMKTLQSGQSCFAEYQTSGRGRRGRTWVSPFGSNIYFSLYWKLESGLAGAMGLSLAIGIAVVNALELLGCQGLKLKWPNDIYWNEKKLAGVLIELSAQSGGEAHVVIGVGINVDLDDRFNAEIDQPWTDLKEVLNKENQRNRLANTLLKSMYQVMEEFQMSGLHPFIERWKTLDNFMNKAITLQTGSKGISGICKGIDEQGAILVEVNGEITSFIGGEISIKKE